ncbi:unnamed protein product [Cunninghamella blakesleeana]
MLDCFKFSIFYKKHALLIRNCYPLKEDGVVPQLAELSYLTFYASSRPAKLTKVGAYLCKKVKRDIRKGRKSKNKVSLHIMKALIQSCHHDISLFGRLVIFILIIILDTRDIELIDLACDTFIVFCSQYGKNSLNVDSIFINDYEHLLQQFTQFAVYPNNDLEPSLIMKYSGHRALAAIAKSSILSSLNPQKQYTIIIPSLLSTISSSKSTINELLASDLAIDHHASVFSVENLSIEWIQKLAVQTLSTLFSQTNGPGVKMLFNPCKDYFNASNRWWPTELCVSIMELMLKSLQSQYRYLLLSNVLSSLDQPFDKNDQSQIDQFSGLTAILTMILTSKSPLMGISVLELLNALYHLMSRTLIACGKLYDTKPDQENENEIDNDQKYYYIQHHIFNGAIGFGSQFCYTNQWNDVVDFIISKIHINPIYSNTETTDHQTLLRLASIRFLDHFQKTIIQENTTLTTPDHDLDFTIEPWMPGLDLLTDLNPDIRIAFADTLIQFLNTSPSQINLETHHHQNAKFIDHLLKTIKYWLQLNNLNTKDMIAIYQLLHCIAIQYNGYGFIRTIPFIFTLQGFAKNEDNDDEDEDDEKKGKIESSSVHLLPNHQHLLAYVTLYWMITVSKQLSLNQLSNYVQSIYEKRREHQQLSIIDLTIQPISKLRSLNENDNLSLSTVVVTEWMDRNTVIEAILKDQKNNNDKSPTQLITSSDLLSKLSLDYGSDSYENEEKAFRIQTNTKAPPTPKITPSLTPNLIKNKQQQSEKQVNVENLKGALGMSLKKEIVGLL